MKGFKKKKKGETEIEDKKKYSILKYIDKEKEGSKEMETLLRLLKVDRKERKKERKTGSEMVRENKKDIAKG